MFKNNEGELVNVNVEALREDIRYTVTWMQEEYSDIDLPFSADLVMRLVVNTVRTINASYTDGVVLAEIEKLTPEFIDVFDQLAGGACSLTRLKKGVNLKQL